MVEAEGVNFDSVFLIDIEREVAPAQWGRALLEHVLLRGAKQAASGEEPHHRPVQVEVVFTIAADEEGRALIISTPGEIEKTLVTRLPLDAPAPTGRP